MYHNLNNEIAVRPNKTVYKDENKIIKLFVENYTKANVLNEALNQSRVEEDTDLNIPKLMEVSKIDNRWAIVTEYIEGKTLEELLKENPEKQDEYIDLFVNIQLNVLSKTVPLLTTLKDKYKRKLKEASINENIKYELLQRLDGMKNHTKLCHGDFNLSNILINDKGECFIIDWAHAAQGNASADAAKTFLNLSIQGKEELAQKYLNVFSEKSNIGKHNIQRWIPIVAAIQMKNASETEKELLSIWTDIVDYQ